MHRVQLFQLWSPRCTDSHVRRPLLERRQSCRRHLVNWIGRRRAIAPTSAKEEGQAQTPRQVVNQLHIINYHSVKVFCEFILLLPDIPHCYTLFSLFSLISSILQSIIFSLVPIITHFLIKFFRTCHKNVPFSSQIPCFCGTSHKLTSSFFPSRFRLFFP